MALSTTTLSLAVEAGATSWPLASLTGIALPSITNGLDPKCFLFCGGEAVRVTGFIGTSSVQVERGQLGSSARSLASGATVYLARASELYQCDPVGVPPSVLPVDPWINTVTGVVWQSSGGSWVPSTSSTTAPAAASAAYPVSTDGVQTLLAAAAVDRSVIINVQVTQAFADGDGAQPTFEIGETGTADAFAATTVFADATLGQSFSFSGTLSADAALLVTATAGTGTTETGAITVTAIAVPA